MIPLTLTTFRFPEPVPLRSATKVCSFSVSSTVVTGLIASLSLTNVTLWSKPKPRVSIAPCTSLVILPSRAVDTPNLPLRKAEVALLLDKAATKSFPPPKCLSTKASSRTNLCASTRTTSLLKASCSLFQPGSPLVKTSNVALI